MLPGMAKLRVTSITLGSTVRWGLPGGVEALGTPREARQMLSCLTELTTQGDHRPRKQQRPQRGKV